MPHWEEICTQLLNDHVILEMIKTNDHQANARCRQMFIKWLDMAPNASWSKLATALHEVKLYTAENAVRNLQKSAGIVN